MPFKSEKQRRWMWANEPEMAEKWTNEEDEIEEGVVKITKRQLRKIIKEEKRKLLSELGEHPMYTSDDELRDIGLDLENILQTAAFMQEKVDTMGSRYGELTHLSTSTRALVKDIQKLFNDWDASLDNLSKSHERGWYK